MDLPDTTILVMAASTPAPGARLPLKNWKLTLPVDKAGQFSGPAAEIKSLPGFSHPDYFYYAADRQALVFRAPAEGATTKGSHYPRCELREMDGKQGAAWDLGYGGSLTATLAIDEVPIKADGSPGRIIVGQIHGQKDELVRLYWERDTLYYMNDHAGPADTETKVTLTDRNGTSPNVPLRERFSYRIATHEGILDVDVVAGGTTYTSSTKISPRWSDDRFYFKAGVYLGVGGPAANVPGKGAGQAAFFRLEIDHGIGRVPGALP